MTMLMLYGVGQQRRAPASPPPSDTPALLAILQARTRRYIPTVKKTIITVKIDGDIQS